MAEKEFDPEDPMSLTGMAVAMPPEEAARAQEKMAECFAEEFMRLGYDDGSVLDLFRDPFYRAPHAVWSERGEEWVKRMIATVREGDDGQGL